jgi:hypothetical protein
MQTGSVRVGEKSEDASTFFSLQVTRCSVVCVVVAPEHVGVGGGLAGVGGR